MTISSRLARPMLASMFVAGGIDAYTNPEPKVKQADVVVGALSARFPSFTYDTETVVRINGAVQAGAGLLLAAGKFRRPAALVLAASIIPTTYADHRFWLEADESARAQQRAHFLKNLGLLGGLLLAAADTEGAPSLGWRAKRQAVHVSEVLSGGRAATATNAHELGERAHVVGTYAQQAASQFAVAGAETARQAAVRGHESADFASERMRVTARRANRVAKRATRRGQDYATVAGHYVHDGVGDASRVMGQASRRGHQFASVAGDRVQYAGSRANRAARRARQAGMQYQKVMSERGALAAGTVARGADRAGEFASIYGARGADVASDFLGRARDRLRG